ncbi:probable RNA-binding protein CG14230 [Venturia canescens]|uniref:probable RNA-binding protein CG14230 n=1 Tax=Venturia canescens TaxID=32260 RepID=UPI001C9BC3C3|nr:probable RNA-binding protein CG14230 [Venturia canescens]
MEKNHRLFLRNLSTDVDKDYLEKLFGEYGTVTNVDIKEKTQNDGKKIGFLNITTTDRNLNACFRAANNKTSEGWSIDVQVAKESYLDRLKREREEAAKGANNASSPKFGTNIDHGGCAGNQATHEIDIKLSTGIKSKGTKRKFDFEDTEWAESPVTESTSLPHFLEDPALSTEPVSNKRPLTSLRNIAEPPSKALRQPKIQENKVVPQSEIKRQASVKEKRQTFKLHEKLISQALKDVDSIRRNKKVVFSEDIDSTVDHEKGTSSPMAGRRVSLFHDDENSDDQEDWNMDKFQHDEKRNAKLKMSLSNPNGDARFVIDERFLDHEEAEETEEERTQSDPMAAEVENEKKWQLNILENVLGKPFKTRDEKIPGKKQNKMIRYDPTSSCHQDHELVMEKPVSKAKKIKSTNVVAQAEETPIPISSEVFYEVSENLTEALNTQEEFSLLKSFGTAPNNDKNSKDEYATQKKSEQNGVKNSFVHDSSSDEDEPPVPITSVDQLTCEPKDRTNDISDTFFFVADDQRFREAEEFFNTRPSMEDDFAKVRRQLKQIVRSKIRNNVKKNNPWRNTKVSKQPKIR